MQFIDLKTQYQQAEAQINQAIKNVLDHGQYIMGPEVKELEVTLAEFVGVNHCLAVSSGTDALQIALMALGIGPGDEVITTPFSFFATAEVILLLGATPIFVDIDPLTYNLDPNLLEQAITTKTKAIMPVSLYGQCADFDAINAISAKYDTPVIEDAAQSFGATYKGKKSCGLSTIACTSFFPSKPLGCYGDGGACFTDDAELAEKMRQIRVHGQQQRYVHATLGMNGRMDTIQAAVLLEKLKLFPQEVIARQEIGIRYNELFGDAVITPSILLNNTSVYAQYTIRVAQRDKLREALQAQEIPTAVHYPIPLNQQPALEKFQIDSDCPNTEVAAASVMSLPMHPYLTVQEQEHIVASVKKAMQQVNDVQVVAS